LTFGFIGCIVCSSGDEMAPPTTYQAHWRLTMTEQMKQALKQALTDRAAKNGNTPKEEVEAQIQHDVQTEWLLAQLKNRK